MLHLNPFFIMKLGLGGTKFLQNWTICILTNKKKWTNHIRTNYNVGTKRILTNKKITMILDILYTLHNIIAFLRSALRAPAAGLIIALDRFAGSRDSMGVESLG